MADNKELEKVRYETFGSWSGRYLRITMDKAKHRIVRKASVSAWSSWIQIYIDNALRSVWVDKPISSRVNIPLICTLYCEFLLEENVAEKNRAIYYVSTEYSKWLGLKNIFESQNLYNTILNISAILTRVQFPDKATRQSSSDMFAKRRYNTSK
jgi:hypothetical protein